MIQDLNKELLLYLNSLTNIKIIEDLVKIFVDAPIFFLPIFLIWMWLYYSIKKENKKKENLLLIFLSILIAVIINLTIKQIVISERPEEAIKWIWKLLLNHIPDASFPSDHASVSFSFLFSLYFYKYKKTFFSFLPFVILMGLSRIIAWVHWPLDILVWVIIWFSSSYTSFYFLQKQKLVKKVNEFIIKLLAIIKL